MRSGFGFVVPHLAVKAASSDLLRDISKPIGNNEDRRMLVALQSLFHLLMNSSLGEMNEVASPSRPTETFLELFTRFPIV